MPKIGNLKCDFISFLNFTRRFPSHPLTRVLYEMADYYIDQGVRFRSTRDVEIELKTKINQEITLVCMGDEKRIGELEIISLKEDSSLFHVIFYGQSERDNKISRRVRHEQVMSLVQDFFGYICCR